MEIIPVIDLLDGEVVHATQGQRSQYRPIHSPLCPSSRPIDVVDALLKLYPFTRLYIADLNAIQQQGENTAAVNQIQTLHPELEIWLDGGFRSLDDFKIWDSLKLSCVLGSESLQSVDHFLRMHASRHEEVILSLDFDARGFIGPAGLLDSPHLWPKDVIVMTLVQVGSNLGPDVSKLGRILELSDTIRKKGPQIYAAGGTRDMADISQLQTMGVAGALAATALHYGRIKTDDIASLNS